MRTKTFWLILLVCLGLGMSACSKEKIAPADAEPMEDQAQAFLPTETLQELPTDTPQVLEPTLQDLIEQNIISIAGVTANGFFGSGFETFSVLVKNDHATPVIITIPCGFVFTPAAEDKQPMMVVQEVSAEAAPGETVELSPTVVCIDSGAAIPEAGDIYTFGALESGKLLQLAECLCESPDTLNDPMGVQFAVWQVSNPSEGGDLNDYSGEAFEALLGEILGEDIPPEMAGIFEGLTGGLDTAADWL